MLLLKEERINPIMENKNMAKIPKESIEKLVQFHDEIGKAFKNIFELQKEQQKVSWGITKKADDIRSVSRRQKPAV